MLDFNDFNEVYNYLEDYDYFTSDELSLITSMYGANLEVLNNAIYARYGYQDLEQMLGVE